MNARVDLPQARGVCPTTTRRLLGEGALLVDVRERPEVAPLAFDVPSMDGGINKGAGKGCPIHGARAAPPATPGSCCSPASTPQRQGGSCC